MNAPQAIKKDSQPTAVEARNQVRYALPLDTYIRRQDVVSDGQRSGNDK